VLVTTGALPTLTATQTAPLMQMSPVAAVKLEYWHKDQLGSLIATTDHAGAVTGRFAYDPFGKRRYTTGTYDAFGTLVLDWTTDTNTGNDRGFTGHEHLDDLGLVHMNGRIFDPHIGRFLQADPFIQARGNLQNYDRYGYCMSSPTSCTDPSGYFFKWLARKIKAEWKRSSLFSRGHCSVGVTLFSPVQSQSGSFSRGQVIQSGSRHSVGVTSFSSVIQGHASFRVRSCLLPLFSRSVGSVGVARFSRGQVLPFAPNPSKLKACPAPCASSSPAPSTT
jgi:RHS repeat-associated protein